MTIDIKQAVGRLCRPLSPIPTGYPRKLKKLAGIRAVLFDIYGTLLISASGDIVAGDREHGREADLRAEAFAQALAEVGLGLRGDPQPGPQILEDQIAREHSTAKASGITYPEVDIVEMWHRTLTRLNQQQLLCDLDGRPVEIEQVDLRRLAVEYELRINPVWPMPHASSCLAQLHRAGLLLGIISNAQFLTIPLWQELLRPEECGFAIAPDLQYYSYQHGWAKPGLRLFELAAEQLRRRDVLPEQTLYIGNDMLRDVFPAREIGFHTALFAGDARSLRLREGDPRVASLSSDLVITDLSDLPKCVVSQAPGELMNSDYSQHEENNE